MPSKTIGVLSRIPGINPEIESERVPIVTLGILVSLFGFQAISALLKHTIDIQKTSDALLLSDLLKWGLVGVIGAFIIWEGVKNIEQSIGLTKPDFRDILHGFLFGVFGVFLLATLSGIVYSLIGRPQHSGLTQTLLQQPLPVRIGIVVTAAITEEILYRGYPITRLESLTGRTDLAALITAVAFTAAHFSVWGIENLIQQFVLANLFIALYLWRRNLYACILMHAVIDIVLIIVIPM